MVSGGWGEEASRFRPNTIANAQPAPREINSDQVPRGPTVDETVTTL